MNQNILVQNTYTLEQKINELYCSILKINMQLPTLKWIKIHWPKNYYDCIREIHEPQIFDRTIYFSSHNI